VDKIKDSLVDLMGKDNSRLHKIHMGVDSLVAVNLQVDNLQADSMEVVLEVGTREQEFIQEREFIQEQEVIQVWEVIKEQEVIQV
jgi:hypothetical protein